jgi:hypothetical protein
MNGVTRRQASYELCVSAKKHLNAIKAHDINPPGTRHYKAPLEQIKQLRNKLDVLERLWSKLDD